MRQNSRTIVRTIPGRLGLVAAGIITVVAMVTPASAVAAPAARSAPAAPDVSGGPIAFTGPAVGTGISCTAHYKWQVTPGLGGSSAVEWTDNNCSFSIQDRSWCVDRNGSGSWYNSGVVLAQNLWDGSTCPPATSPTSGFSIKRGEVRFMDYNGWRTYQSFWAASS